jgi:hypothetical protein
MSAQMNPIQKTMLSMLFWLRVGVGAAGLSLPMILVVCGEFNHVHFADSMSAYYHVTQNCPDPDSLQSAGQVIPCSVPGQGPMRDWFVGNLFFIGAAMLLIKGFSNFEDFLLNLAGIFVICVALISVPWSSAPVPRFSLHWFHQPCAILFFVCVGLTCEFCSGKTLKYVPVRPVHGRSRAFFRNWYHVFAIIMIAAPIIAFYVGLSVGHRGFWLEAASVAAFGLYWLFKTWELSDSDIERKSIRGEIDLDRASWR